LQHELSQLEDDLQMARRYYNGTVRNQNVLVQAFPSNLVAGTFGFAQREYFELSDAAARDVPQVSLAGQAR
jgi:LemA protein